ncbi:NifB/NifX family molybdenum-iron cluster-binding protein [Vibrio artabrorum]|uniref:NifB/NifX family molybdenum-iron cluster-binding protein n=1 Tax=Vibrio artabrorum TaxID=446374 RepID=A0ABT8CIM3_9VIBR|nr:NifB/NifX family molybdenum-iron cluster-binding protein [Vibrio artabrorum]MDN3701567.1 NifB/NifX family molybdenum-iron cluster-binding protein [Vibrio artabrorum]
MLYAVPCRDLHVGNHFARSPEIAIVDQQRQIKQIVPLVESDTSCNKKKQWISVLRSYDVEAVVVRHIGKKMLAHLFNNDIRVLASTGKAEIGTLDFDNLREVTDLDYGREPRNSGCGNKTCGAKGHKKQTSILMPQPNQLGAIRGFRK